jgi:hypothetical protein
MPETLRQLILSLCNDTEEVIDNGDWPTGGDNEVAARILEIREQLGAA